MFSLRKWSVVLDGLAGRSPVSSCQTSDGLQRLTPVLSGEREREGTTDVTRG